MFERFTERARQVVVLAQDEARTLQQDSIGTEHILVALILEESGLAARVLASLDITLEKVRQKAARADYEPVASNVAQIPFTPQAKKALDLGLREALALGHNYIGTEHILLGLIRETNCAAALILRGFGASGEIVRAEIIRMLAGPARKPTRDPKAALLSLLAALDVQKDCPHNECGDCQKHLEDMMRNAKEACA